MCIRDRYYAEVYYLPVKIIRCPFLCSAQNPTDYFYRMFRRIEEEQKVEIAENPEQRTNFIRLEEVGEFLFRLFDDWDGKTETLNLFGCSKATFADLAAGIEKLSLIHISLRACCPRAWWRSPRAG